jgi:putative FmdB family regulatory protein
MPIYEYKCRKCSEVSEAWQKFSDPPLSRCPSCGGKVEKIISMNAFHLKGSGWYTTDYAGKNTSTGKGCEGAAEAGGTGCDCGCASSACKPAEKAEKKPKKKAAPAAE